MTNENENTSNDVTSNASNVTSDAPATPATTPAKRQRNRAGRAANASKTSAKTPASSKSPANDKTCSVAEIARSLSISEKTARAKCRRHVDAFSKFKHVAGASRWTFNASARDAIAKFLQS